MYRILSIFVLNPYDMAEDIKKKLFLLDGMALIFRAHYAFIKNPRISSKGLNTSALYGYSNTLLEIIQKEKPTHLGVSFDTKAPTFRHEMFKEYKAGRQETPEDIIISIPLVKQLTEAFGIPVLVMDGFEADDIIGTLAKKAEAAGFDEVFMMTPDKDYYQLVTEKIKVYKPAFMGNPPEIMDIPKILEKWKIAKIDQVIDMLGLMGDAVDNIPGIPGVGEKTAQKLIAQYNSVEGLLEHTDELKGKLKEKVENNKDLAILSKQLATIKLDVPVEFDEAALEYPAIPLDKVTPLFEEYEFRTLMKRLGGTASPAASTTTAKSTATKSNENQMGLFDMGAAEESEEVPVRKRTLHNTVSRYHFVDTDAKLNELIPFLMMQDELCFDTETTGVDANIAEIVGASFCYHAGEAFYVPFSPDPKEARAKLELLRPVFENASIVKIGQNIKYDIMILARYGINVTGKIFDTMLAHYLVAPEQRHNMDHLAEEYLNYTPVSITELIGKKGAKQGNMRDLPQESIVNYACEDADVTFQLKGLLEPAVAAVGELDLLQDIETPLVPVLAKVESHGVRLDSEFLNKYSIELGSESTEIEKAIYKEAGVEFNIASPKQLGEVLFETLKIDTKAKKTKTGQYATGEEILVKYANDHPIANMILEYRELNKLKSTYVDALPQMVNEQSKKIHTSFNQAVAATGRLSSVNPNLQNIPIRTERGRKIRKAFIPSDDNHVLLSADYSQVELRIMAHYSEDKHMLEAFKNGVDIHSSTASKVFEVGLDEVTTDMRRKAKMVNFGIIYGISAFGLAQRLDIARKEAGDIIDAYFNEFSSVKTFMDKAVNLARDNGYSETLYGRRRYLKDINSRNFTVRSFAERNAINAPIQGSAADIIKIAMIQMQDYLDKEKLKSKMILQVHDELVFDVPKEELDILTPKVAEIMSGAADLKVPLEVETGTGDDWLAAH